MVIPFLVGLAIFIRPKYTREKKLFIWLIFISVIPAALSNDPFYTLRVLLFLWCISIIIAGGMVSIYKKINNKRLAFALTILVVLISLTSFHRKYFVLFKYERAHTFGYLDKVVSDYIKDSEDNILIDYTDRDLSLSLIHISEPTRQKLSRMPSSA